MRYISSADKNKIMNEFNNTDIDYAKEKTIHSLFEEQVKRTPQKIAVEFLDESITYSELNHKANKLAVKLRNKGVRPDSFVVIIIDRSIELIIAIMAVLKSGGAYVPIDPQYPVDRIRYMLNNCGANMVITQRNFKQYADIKAKTIILINDELFHENIENLPAVNSSSDLSYMIYTSGSTGNPKGIMLEHKSTHNFIVGMKNIINFNEIETIVSLTSVSFDIFVFESLLPLTSGIKVIIAKILNFEKYVNNKRIDLIQTTPSTLSLLLKESNNIPYIEKLKYLIIGGETFPEDLLHKIRKVTSAVVYNMYGPTETSVWSTAKRIKEDNVITIGRPIANTKIYILGENYENKAIGEPGGLYIAGDGLARGYTNKEYTIKNFVNNPFITGEKMYKTGDVAKWLENGEIEFIGRLDNQVKIRGFRIETDEIESLMRKKEGITDCVVVAKDNNEGFKYLICYYIAKETYSVTKLISYLSQFLPEYMIPSFFIKLDKFPLTPNGKLDKLVLPFPDKKRPKLKNIYVPAVTEIEVRINALWKNILYKDMVGVDDNFFELGGNSVSLVQMYLELQKMYPGLITLPDIFTYPTIKKLCLYINKSLQKSKVYKMKGMVFPEAYFVKTEESVRSFSFQYTLQKYISRNEKQRYSNLELKQLIGLYTSVLSFMCNTMIVDVGIKTEKEDTFKFITMDFNKIESIDSIYTLYTEASAKAENIYRFDELKYNTESIRHLTPLIVLNGSVLNEYIRTFGLVLLLKEQEDSINIILDYNDNLLNGTKVELIYKQYIKLITSLGDKQKHK